MKNWQCLNLLRGYPRCDFCDSRCPNFIGFEELVRVIDDEAPEIKDRIYNKAHNIIIDEIINRKDCQE